VPDASAGRRRLQVGPGVPRAARPTEEGPGLRQDAAVRSGGGGGRSGGAAGEVRAGGGRSRGENQPGGELHHQRVSHRVRAHGV